ncbi:hypothetical protein DMB90_15325 [Raoultella planticola]|uniref:Uncharacterized protein n=1 Tax=Raoultella planticola TaxID=575 RepID=A0A5P6AAZ1_RAOPL|nr:hypothetical protein DMB90_15325 [Raoultella planticola]
MMCSNQLSYVAIFFRVTLSALRGALCVLGLRASTLFNENRRNVTVWLGCEQRDGIIGNYWLFIAFLQ